MTKVRFTRDTTQYEWPEIIAAGTEDDLPDDQVQRWLRRGAIEVLAGPLKGTGQPAAASQEEPPAETPDDNQADDTAAPADEPPKKPAAKPPKKPKG